MLLLPLLAVPLGAAAAATDGTSRGQAFWRELAKECTVPQGETAYGLVRESVEFLGMIDPAWRDEIAYGVIVACAYQQERLTPAEREQLINTLSENLRRGIGQHGDDRVLLRSYSALDLSVLAALDQQRPALDDEHYRRLVDDAFAYLRDERDLRGFEPRVGWIHATAHTADLLKFLARDSRFTAADQARLLDAIWDKMTSAGTPVFTHSEDERLAAAVVSLVRRPDFEPARLDPWLARFVALEKTTFERSPPDTTALDASQNARNLLRSLHLLLTFAKPDPTPGQFTTRDKVLETLQSIRR